MGTNMKNTDYNLKTEIKKKVSIKINQVINRENKEEN